MVPRRRVLVLRALRVPAERAAWGSIGAGQLLYGCGSTFYNLELASCSAVAFPSLADALWLSLLPLTLAGMSPRSGASSTRRSPTSTCSAIRHRPDGEELRLEHETTRDSASKNSERPFSFSSRRIGDAGADHV